MSKPKVIAFYLPQYHPTPDNDRWWGKGFTEWTNVGKAKPLFRGHYQPRVPADLGYYDLRLPEVREAQAELAKEAGLYGFCYYHYWFGNGKEELELPFNEVLRTGKPDFPFMLCWANESWHKKFWDKDGKGNSKEVLIEQTYPGEQDIIDHFYRLLPAFRDKRYIKIDNKPAFMIYMPDLIPEVDFFIKRWNELAIKEGLDGIYFIGYFHSIHTDEEESSEIIHLYKKGFNAVGTVRLSRPVAFRNTFEKIKGKIYSRILNWPICIPYRKAIKYFIGEVDKMEEVFPTLIPNWDHTPRSGNKGLVYTKSTPMMFKKYAKSVLEEVKNKTPEKRVVFLKSWNEWGEGNYLEPDLRYGNEYIKAMAASLDEVNKR